MGNAPFCPKIWFIISCSFLIFNKKPVRTTFTIPLPSYIIIEVILTIPFVVYGIFRYLYLLQVKHQGGAPEEVLLSDRWLQGTILLYALSAVWAIYL